MLYYPRYSTEMESSRTLLASRTSSKIHFEVLGLKGKVLGLGHEASSPRKFPCPRFENSTIFWTFKILLKNANNLAENLRTPFLYSSTGDSLKKIYEDLCSWRMPKKNWILFSYWRTLVPVSLSLASRWSVLGRVLLGLGLGFFCVLGLEPCFLDSTSAPIFYEWYINGRKC